MSGEIFPEFDDFDEPPLPKLYDFDSEDDILKLISLGVIDFVFKDDSLHSRKKYYVNEFNKLIIENHLKRIEEERQLLKKGRERFFINKRGEVLSELIANKEPIKLLPNKLFERWKNIDREIRLEFAKKRIEL